MVAAAPAGRLARSRTSPQSLPAGTTFETRRMDPFVFPVYGLSLSSTSDRSQVELRDRALYELAPRLSTVAGVSRVAVQGGGVPPSSRCCSTRRGSTRSGLPPRSRTTVKAISASNVIQAVTAGWSGRSSSTCCCADSQIVDTSTLNRVILRSDARGLIELEDVAEVRVGTAPDWTRVTAAGRRRRAAPTMYQQPDGNTVQIARDVAARVQDVPARAAAPDLHLATWYDQSELIEVVGRRGALR